MYKREHRARVCRTESAAEENERDLHVHERRAECQIGTGDVAPSSGEPRPCRQGLWHHRAALQLALFIPLSVQISCAACCVAPRPSSPLLSFLLLLARRQPHPPRLSAHRWRRRAAVSRLLRMPFERYLQQPQPSQQSAVDGGYSPSTSHSAQQTHQHSNDHPNYDARDGELDSATFSRPIQFQMPQFMYAGPPTLALGGGAEVLPAGMFSSPGGGMSSLAGSQWFQNSGFGKTGEQMCVFSSICTAGCAMRDLLCRFVHLLRR